MDCENNYYMLNDEIQYLTEMSGILRKKWSICILTDLFLGTTRFQELYEHIPNVSEKVLNETLILLEKNDLIEKRILSEKPKSTEYHLTNKGKDTKNFIIEYYRFLLNFTRNNKEEKIILEILNQLKEI